AATPGRGVGVTSDPEAVARRLFGVALRHVRTSAGLSLRDLGKRCHHDYSRLSRMEPGEHLGDPALLAEIDRILGAGGLLTALRTAAELPSNPPGPVVAAPVVGMGHDGDGAVIMLEMRMADGRSVRVLIPRREFGQLLATGALGALFPAGVLTPDDVDRLATVLAQPGRVDQQVVGYFERLLIEHHTADRILGPHQLLGPVMAQLEMLDTLRKHARPPVAKALLRMLAQYAEFVGWLQQDAGDLPVAMYWSDRATQWAQSACDYQMGSYLLFRKSSIAYLTDDANTVIELAAAAQDSPGGISPKIVSLAAEQEARGWAMINGGDHCRRKLDTAAELLSTHPDEADAAVPDYVQHYDLGTLEARSAVCYRAIGRAEDAIVIIERKIVSLPAHLHRNRGYQMAKLANTVLATKQPDPERATQLGLACLDLARQTGSARIAKELGILNATLTARWPDQPDVRTFHDALTTPP
ncbi:MAG: helix-turn-helix domain-containing protein, partial [Pseudonocardiaceae bacterium]